MEQYSLTSRSNKTVGSTFKDNGNVKKCVYLVRCRAGAHCAQLLKWGQNTTLALDGLPGVTLVRHTDPEITQMYLSRVIKQIQPVAFQV